MNVDVAVLFALKEEFQEFRGMLPADAKVDIDDKTQRAFIIADLDGGYRVATSFVGSMGIPDAQHFTQLVLARYAPQTVVVVGIAGSLSKDVRVGDLVIADQVYDYVQDGKITTAGFASAGRAYRANVELRNVIQYLELTQPKIYEELVQASVDDLKASVPDGLPKLASIVRDSGAQIHCGHIASGPVVGASAAFTTWLRERDRKLLAIEMETAGVMNAVYQNAGDERVLVLRAISDLSDERKSDLDEGTGGKLRALAMRNALRLLRVLFRTQQLRKHQQIERPVVPVPAPQLPTRAADVEALLGELADPDPLTCLPAAERLATTGVTAEQILQRASTSTIAALAARRLVGALASRVAETMKHWIQTKPWGESIRAAVLCTPELAQYLEKPIGEGLGAYPDPDRLRVRIIAHGRMVSSYAWKLADIVLYVEDNDDLYAKYESACIEALARIFARAAKPGFFARQTVDRVGFDYMRAMESSYRASAGGKDHWFTRISAFAACGPIQADVALERFTKSELPAIHMDAARILGSTRFSRGVPWLIDIVGKESDARSSAAWALTRIGGSDALDALQRYDTNDSVRMMLALRASELSEQWLAIQAVLPPHSFHWALVRAAGLQRSHRPLIEDGLRSKTSIVRGCAALALARLDGVAALGRLATCHAEAVDHNERVFTALALLHVDASRFNAMEGQLRRDLALDSFFLESVLKEDILATLAPIPEAQRLRTVWSGLYQSGASWHA